jgi:hypothetical protein
VIGFDPIVEVLLHDMTSGGQQLVEDSRVGGRSSSGYVGWAWAVLNARVKNR